MGWFLRLVEIGDQDPGGSIDVMEIIHPSDVGDIAALGLTLSGGKRILTQVQQEIVAAQSPNHAARRPTVRGRVPSQGLSPSPDRDPVWPGYDPAAAPARRARHLRLRDWQVSAAQHRAHPRFATGIEQSGDQGTATPSSGHRSRSPSPPPGAPAGPRLPPAWLGSPPRRETTSRPSVSTPWSWNTCFAKSIPKTAMLMAALPVLTPYQGGSGGRCLFHKGELDSAHDIIS